MCLCILYAKPQINESSQNVCQRERGGGGEEVKRVINGVTMHNGIANIKPIVRKPWRDIFTYYLSLITYYLLLITYNLLLITYYLLLITYYLLLITYHITGPRSAVSNVSGNRCESDCRSRGRKFDPGPVPYFRGD